MKLGLLPLYAALYDRIDPPFRETYTPYLTELIEKLTARKVDVAAAPICTTLHEVASAVAGFEASGVSCIGVVFLAYHPSMQSAPVLAKTRLPVVILDTTPCFDFGPASSPDGIMPCHGIHGVQDLTCVLRRMGKPYTIAAGYYKDAAFWNRALTQLRAASMANAFTHARVGIIGEPFADMGDFELPYDEIAARTGVRVVPLAPSSCAEAYDSVTDDELAARVNALREDYAVKISDALLENGARTTFAVEKLVRAKNLTALTFNFLDFTRDLGLPTIPFIAACELQHAGIGYAGEGDVLTAALTAALLSGYPQTSFCEMFCPDWRGDRIFMSHMGEINRRVTKRAQLIDKPVPYVPRVMSAPSVGGVFMDGSATLVNLSPGRDHMTLLLSQVHMECPDSDAFDGSVRGWMDPVRPVHEFLTAYSMNAGTHHSALVYGGDITCLESFAALCGFRTERV